MLRRHHPAGFFVHPVFTYIFHFSRPLPMPIWQCSNSASSTNIGILSSSFFFCKNTKINIVLGQSQKTPSACPHQPLTFNFYFESDTSYLGTRRREGSGLRWRRRYSPRAGRRSIAADQVFFQFVPYFINSYSRQPCLTMACESPVAPSSPNTVLFFCLFY